MSQLQEFSFSCNVDAFAEATAFKPHDIQDVPRPL